MNRRTDCRAFTLIELIVYMAVLAVVLGMATPAFYQCLKRSRDLRRNADDIVRVLRAGERWRADVRSAVAEPVLVGEALHIPQQACEIIYTFTDGTVWRHANGGNAPVLKRVKESQMQFDQRTHVSCWRWEIELASPQPVVHIRPLFTFQAATTSHS